MVYRLGRDLGIDAMDGSGRKYRDLRKREWEKT
jgi:hypothetical protein